MNQAELDQALAQMRDVVPAMAWAIYQGSLNSGFTEQQSFEMAREGLTVFLRHALNKDRPTDGD